MTIPSVVGFGELCNDELTKRGIHSHSKDKINIPKYSNLDSGII